VIEYSNKCKSGVDMRDKLELWNWEKEGKEKNIKMLKHSMNSDNSELNGKLHQKLWHHIWHSEIEYTLLD